MLDPEVIKALELVAEFERNKAKVVVEYRLYYNDDGSIIGLWESDYPEGKYIILEDRSLFYSMNTHHLKVVKGTLKYIDPTIKPELRIIKSLTGQPTVIGHAALALLPDEEYKDVVYYDRNN